MNRCISIWEKEDRGTGDMAPATNHTYEFAVGNSCKFQKVPNHSHHHTSKSLTNLFDVWWCDHEWFSSVQYWVAITYKHVHEVFMFVAFPIVASYYTLLYIYA